MSNTSLSTFKGVYAMVNPNIVGTHKAEKEGFIVVLCDLFFASIRPFFEMSRIFLLCVEYVYSCYNITIECPLSYEQYINIFNGQEKL